MRKGMLLEGPSSWTPKMCRAKLAVKRETLMDTMSFVNLPFSGLIDILSAQKRGVMTAFVSLCVNGKQATFEADPRTLLVEALREHLHLTGTHVGCDTSQCGCCTVLVDGDAVKSCTMLAVQAEGCSVTTIEGIDGPDGSLHPVQKAFIDHHALQCGFCTPGFVMSSVELIERYQQLDEERVRHLIEGNICRCTGYHNIVRAIMAAAKDWASPSQTVGADHV
jgi:aerobic carbon-monoxide dehydrogenase small subunit